MVSEYREYEIYIETDRENWNEAEYKAVRKAKDGSVQDEFHGYTNDYRDWNFIKTLIDIRLEW